MNWREIPQQTSPVAPRPKKTQNRQAAKFSSPNVFIKILVAQFGLPVCGASFDAMHFRAAHVPDCRFRWLQQGSCLFSKKMCRGLEPLVQAYHHLGYLNARSAKKRTGLLIFSPKVLKPSPSSHSPVGNKTGPAKLCQSISACKRGAAGEVHVNRC